jgi:3-hydroxy-9,10-secoandrosta-1,3,5(10)-triene-9,17-dione monooxygenase
MTDTLPRNQWLAQPEPGLTESEVIHRARGMRPYLLERQGEIDLLSGITPEIHEMFHAAGFYRLVQPRRYGGYEFSIRTFAEVVKEVTRGCPSAGWNLSLAASHSLAIANIFDERCQTEFFGPDGEFIAPFPVAPTGTATKTDGGWIINGRWDFASGVNVSTHFLAGVLIFTEPGGPPGPGVVVMKDGWTMLDNWGDIIGMKGSGSNSVVVDHVLVPDHWVLPFDIGNMDLSNGSPGSRLHGNSLYGGQFISWFNVQLVSIAVGIAWAAFDEFERVITTKMTQLPPQQLRASHPDQQRMLGVAWGLIQGAERIIRSIADDYAVLCEESCNGGQTFTGLMDDELCVPARQAGQMAIQATEMLTTAVGASPLADGQRMQRYLRDILTYRSHLNSQHEMLAARFAARRLGY